MDEKELKLLLDDVSANLNRKNKDGWFKMMIATFGIFTLTVIFTAGAIYRDFQTLKKNSIPKHEWTDNEFKTNATYNKVFNIPREAYTTRGGSPSND